MRWTITELAAAATATLSGELVRVNGRIRDLPNERMIRWYTTIGLVDPPLARRGRTALYGRRHLLQLVAVKRRQAAGRSIAEIQVELTGATDLTLEHIARLPGEILPEAEQEPPGVTEREAPQKARTSGSRARFWTAAARDHAEVRGTAERTTARSHPADTEDPVDLEWVGTSDAAVDLPGEHALVHGIRLAPGTLLLLDGGAPAADLAAADLAAIRVAARPLLAELGRRGLLPAPPPSSSAQFPTGRST